MLSCGVHVQYICKVIQCFNTFFLNHHNFQSHVHDNHNLKVVQGTCVHVYKSVLSSLGGGQRERLQVYSYHTLPAPHMHLWWLCALNFRIISHNVQLPSQQQLTEGIVPPFYANKVQLSYSVDNAPTHIFLCILHTCICVYIISHCTCCLKSPIFACIL